MRCVDALEQGCLNIDWVALAVAQATHRPSTQVQLPTQLERGLPPSKHALDGVLRKPALQREGGALHKGKRRERGHW